MNRYVFALLLSTSLSFGALFGAQQVRENKTKEDWAAAAAAQQGQAQAQQAQPQPVQPEIKVQAAVYAAVAPKNNRVTDWLNQETRVATKLMKSLEQAVEDLRYGLALAVNQAGLGREKEFKETIASCQKAVQELATLIPAQADKGHNSETYALAQQFHKGLAYIMQELNKLGQAAIQEQTIPTLRRLSWFSQNLFTALRQVDPEIEPINSAIADIWTYMDDLEALRQGDLATQTRGNPQRKVGWLRLALDMPGKLVVNKLGQMFGKSEGRLNFYLTADQVDELSEKIDSMLELLEALKKKYPLNEIIAQEVEIIRGIGNEIVTGESTRLNWNIDTIGRKRYYHTAHFVREKLLLLEECLDSINNAVTALHAGSLAQNQEQAKESRALLEDMWKMNRCQLSMVQSSQNRKLQKLIGACMLGCQGLEAVAKRGQISSAKAKEALEKLLKILGKDEHKKVIRLLIAGYGKAKDSKHLLAWITANAKTFGVDDLNFIVNFVGDELLSDGLFVTILRNVSNSAQQFIDAYAARRATVEQAAEIVYDLFQVLGVSKSFANLSKMIMKHSDKVERALKVMRGVADSHVPVNTTQAVLDMMEQGQKILEHVHHVAGDLQEVLQGATVDAATYRDAFGKVASVSAEIDEEFHIPQVIQPQAQQAPQPQATTGQPQAQPQAAQPQVVREAKTNHAEAQKLAGEQETAYNATFKNEAAYKAYQEQHAARDKAGAELRNAEQSYATFDARATAWSSWWRGKIFGVIYRWWNQEKYDRPRREAQAAQAQAQQAIKQFEDQRTQAYTAQQDKARLIHAMQGDGALVPAADIEPYSKWAQGEARITELQKRHDALQRERGSEERRREIHAENHQGRGWFSWRTWYNGFRRRFGKYHAVQQQHTTKIAYLESAIAAVDAELVQLRTQQAEYHRALKPKLKGHIFTSLCGLSKIFEVLEPHKAAR